MFPNPRLLKLAQKSLVWLILTILLGLFSGFFTIGQAGTISQVVSQVFLDGKTLKDVSGLLTLTLLFFTAKALLAWLSSISAKTIAVHVKTRVRETLLKKLEELGPVYLKGEKSGEISSTVVEGVEALDAYFSQYLPQLVLSALVPLTILIFVFPRDILSGFVLLVTAPLIPYFMYLIGNSAKVITDRQFSTLSRLASQFLDSLQGLTTLKLYNQAKAHTERIREASDQYRVTTMKVLQVTFLSALVLELLATLSTAIVAVEIGLRLLYFNVSFEQALFLLMIAPEFYIPLRMLGLRFHAGMQGQSAADRIFEILDQVPLEEEDSQESKITDLSLPIKKITLEGVSFTYPGENKPALQDLTLKIKAGEQIALVGKSGSGKSTLASLLLGFFPPSSGNIQINDQNLERVDLKEWREQIAWVPQAPALFQDTIAANIRLARPDADLSAVAAAASAAHLTEFIESLPEGYETLIGEDGARLSGGQAQRLALARAFLKDAPILLLDEPTSQLDPDTESHLADATHQLIKDRTSITIAHRLNTVFQADRILVLNEGRLVEAGTHQQLIKKDGVYKELVQAYTGSGKSDQLPAAGDLKSSSNNSEVDSPAINKEIQTTAKDNRFTAAAGSSTLRRLIRFFRQHWGEVLGSALLGFLTVGSSVGLMGASAWLISTAALHPPLAALNIAIVGVRFFGITRGISRYGERLVSHNLTFKILTKLRVWFYKSLVPLAPARLLNYRSGDLLSRIISDIKTLEDFYVRSLSPPLVAILVGSGTSLFLGLYHPGFSLILAGLFVLGGLALPWLVHKLSQNPGITLVNQRALLSENLVSFVQGLPDLLVFGQAEAKRTQLEKASRKYNKAQLKLVRISGLSGGLFIFISNLATWLVLVLAIPLVTAGEIPGVMLAALVLMTLSSFESVQPLPQAMETLSSSLQSGSRLFEVVDAKPAVVEPDEAVPFPKTLQFEAKDLSFIYPGSQDPALQNINFQLEGGSKLAIVGPSGGGKTTLINLLLRFWEYYQGDLLLGNPGLSLHSLRGDQLRSMISVVSQRGYLFNDTIRENLSIGKPGATEGEIILVAKKARIHDLIVTLPAGYESFLGEQGYRFSAGERQRLNIARAVLNNAPILLLDEPTANLDPITEREVLDTLFEVMTGKTTILVTHRLVKLDRFDQILVLDGGRIIERGTEKELLSRSGLYQRMYSQQNRILSY